MIRNMKSLFFLCLFFCAQEASAQITRCATDENHQHLLNEHATYAKERERINANTARYLSNPSKQRNTITIPVVFHVLYNTPTQNISNEQILSQLDVLNKDFKKLNADAQLTPAAFQSVAADCDIQFCLAQQDPQGQATTGIIRVPTSVTGFTNNDAVKFSAQGGSDAWDRNRYLNIWICNFSVGLLGYAQFPGGPAATDGVVCNYVSCGTIGTATYPYNKGRTLTHEIAHWLNLKHIWGDDGTGCFGSDDVFDTPNQAGYNSTCQTFPKISCNNGPNGDMFMNFMDYTPDACMYMFTEGQKMVMQAQFVNGGSRASLLSSSACSPGIVLNCEEPLSISGSNFSDNFAQVTWNTTTFSQGYTFEYKSSSDVNWNSLNCGGNTLMLYGLQPATSYTCRVRSNCNGSISNWSNTYSFTTLSSPCDVPLNIQASNIGINQSTITWNTTPASVGYLIQYKWIEDTIWTNQIIGNANSITLSNLISSATYQVRIQSNCGIVNSPWSNSIQFNTLSPACSNSYEANETKATAKIIPVNNSIASMIQTASDKDYYRFTTTNAAPKISVVMNNLPADYDIRLLASNGLTTHVMGQKRGLNSEKLTWNTPTAGATYFLYVTGYNGSFNNATCYNITLRTSSSAFKEDVIDEFIESEPGFICYPNPAQNYIYINTTASIQENDAWAIYDMLGRVVTRPTLTYSFDENKYRIDVSNLNDGIYMLEHMGEFERNTQRLVIRK